MKITKNILLVDDERSFTDCRETAVARTSGEAITILETHDFDEVWLDFVLAGMDDTMAVAFYIQKRYREGNPVQVGEFIVHSSATGAYQLLESILSPLGYRIRPEWETGTIFTWPGKGQ